MEVMMPPQIRIAGVDGARIIQRKYFCSRFQRNFGEPTSATSRIQYPLPRYMRRGPAGGPPKARRGDRMPGIAIQLCFAKFVPLQTEIASVVGFWNEPWNEIANCIFIPAVVRNKAARFDLPLAVFGRLYKKRLASLRATNDVKQFQLHRMSLTTFTYLYDINTENLLGIHSAKAPASPEKKAAGCSTILCA